VNFALDKNMPKHYNIPIFIPELACPFRCVFCNQRKISGHITIPSPDDILKIVNNHLATFTHESRNVDIAFFGGNFTGIPLQEQEQYLRLVEPFVLSQQVQGIRISTRPDYINDEVLDLLRRFHVTTIELGAQSFDDEVLHKSFRGHSALQTEKASRLILESGFHLGLQMMIGLPGDSLQAALHTALRIVALGATSTRIYPTVVIKQTALHQWYNEGKYQPLSLEEAIRWTAYLLPVFETANIDILRVGLHPSEGLVLGKELIAGPFHPQFRELVLSHIWRNQLEKATESLEVSRLEIHIAPGQMNYAVGHKKSNKLWLDSRYRIRFVEDKQLAGREFRIEAIR
jgi:histone acetyltransferase (RNA polymerase elongator complex component)